MPLLIYYAEMMLLLSANLSCIFTVTKALLTAAVFHAGSTSIPLSPALKQLQNKQGE